MRAHVEIINLKFCLGIQIQPSKSFQKMKSKTTEKASKNTGEQAKYITDFLRFTLAL